MSITVQYIDPTLLPDTPYNMWVNGELDDFVHAPEGSKVEVIGGQIVVSPPALPEHNGMVADIIDALADARADRPGFPWGFDINSGLSFIGTGKGFVPDLTIMSREAVLAVRKAQVKKIVPDQVELVVEVTSASNADGDRRPPARRPDNKWNNYAASGIPYYLLVDRDPRVARTILYSIPDEGAAAYLHEESWAFGETVHLPEPIDLTIPTDLWEPWSK
ncbi:Uma2 family endonuclease [Actinomadura hibisca]|uniref:Uma2 family endonuclease n=1 Tax=Actinomadura hibisca TaxID=68565 RepID=UPI0008322823|nr:Uma2 family endonuclease [Actinomadura hibisca]